MRSSVQVLGEPGFSNKASRALWFFVRRLLFAPTPRPLHGWRVSLLRLFGAKIGQDVKVYPDAQIWAPWNLELRDGSTLGDGVHCYNVAKIVLGVGAIVSQRAFLCSASHDFENERFPLVAAPIVVGDGAWVAAEAFVGPGVTIAYGAIVGARAVVMGDVSERQIVVGNPARCIGDRKLATIPHRPLA